MRRLSAVLAFFAAIALVVAMPAPASADPPGNNGTIKIHDQSENEPLRANEPHPGCTFHIHGFNFDGGSSGTWRIVAWPPTGDGSTVAASGVWSANGSGEWRAGDMSLASGHYKAFAKQTSPMSPGGDKQKVFWVECGSRSAASAPPSTPPPSSAAPSTSAASSSAPSTASPSPTQLGVQEAPAAVTPIVETPAEQVQAQQAPAQQPALQVQGQQQPVPLTELPSTSTAP